MKQKHLQASSSIRKSKRPFLLVEALIAIALLLSAGSIFFYTESRNSSVAIKNQLQAEAERMHGIALCHFIEELHKNVYNVSEMKKGWHTDYGPIAGKENRWIASYSINPVLDDKHALMNKESLQSIRIDVSISLKCIDNKKMDPIKFPQSFRFCVRLT